MEKKTRSVNGRERGGGRSSGPPLEFAKLNIADITRNEKKVIFHMCTSTVIRQTESIHKITITLLPIFKQWRYNYLGLSRLGFEHPAFRVRCELFCL